MGRDIRHQMLRVALSVKVNGKRRRLSLHSRPTFCRATLHTHTCETQCENYRNSLTGWRYPHTLKSGLRRLPGAYPHTKISGTQSYPDTHLGIQLACMLLSK